MWLGWAVFFTNFRHRWMTATALTWLACAVFFRHHWMTSTALTWLAVFFRHCWMTGTVLTWLACAVFFRHHWIVNDSHSVDMTACAVFFRHHWIVNDNHGIDMTCLRYVFQALLNSESEWQPQHWQWHDLPVLRFSGTAEWQPQHADCALGWGGEQCDHCPGQVQQPCHRAQQQSVPVQRLWSNIHRYHGQDQGVHAPCSHHWQVLQLGCGQQPCELAIPCCFVVTSANFTRSKHTNLKD